MSPKTFWTIFIKMLGMWLVLEIFTVIIQFISSLLSVVRSNEVGELFGILIILVLTMGVYIIILRFCIFRPDWIIEKLKLAEGFEEEKFELNIHRSTVLRISTIVLGGLILANGLPDLCKQIFSYFQQKTISTLVVNPTTTWIVFYFVKTFVGYFLMTNSRLIVNYIERNRKI